MMSLVMAERVGPSGRCQFLKGEREGSGTTIVTIFDKS